MKKLKLKLRKECWFRKVTPAFARRYPKYAGFVGMYVVTEYIDAGNGHHLDEGYIVDEFAIFDMQRAFGPVDDHPHNHEALFTDMRHRRSYFATA